MLGRSNKNLEDDFKLHESSSYDEQERQLIIDLQHLKQNRDNISALNKQETRSLKRNNSYQ